MLKVECLSVSYGEYRAVTEISFHIAPGELVTFIGANGAGKTSTIRAILGLVKQSTGSILLAGRDVTAMPAHERVRNGISIVPEGRKIFPELSVIQNLHMGAYTLEDKAQQARNLDWVFELFPILRERRDQAGGNLSGGEQQMLAIGRALMNTPKLLLIDEMSMGLMPIFVDKVFELVKRLNREGMTVLLVEQNAKKALAVADRAYVLKTGRIVLHDSADNLRQNPEIQQAYLGG
ncbi:MAG: ABC transporter ATP-binding protein [Desulfobacterales bacterium]